MEEKYRKLLDKEMLDFVEKTESLYSSNSINSTTEDHRKKYNEMAEFFYSGRPSNLNVADEVVSHVPIRSYMPEPEGSVTIFYMHGGGFILGGLDSHDDVCSELADLTKMKVISIDYSLAPEFSFCDALEDCIKVIEKMSPSDSSIVLVGDSAGGTLAANLSVHFRDTEMPNILGQVLIYPGLGGDSNKGSYVRHANAPLLSRNEIEFYRDIIFPNPSKGEFRSGLVLQSKDFENLPNTIVFSAEFDPLSDEGGEYCKKIRKAGGRSKWYLELGLVHGYLRARHSSKKARASFVRIKDSILELIEDR